ncbi:WxL domain-containing protein [Enterococcus faecium]|nr:WxL domain-containing protein [Enterococcus faecium]
MKKHVALFSSVLMMSTTLLGAGSVFAASQDITATPGNTSTNVTATLELPDNGGTNPTPPNPEPNPEPDPENPGNKPNNPNKAFGVAYQPNIFSIESTKLNEAGEQVIPIKMPKNSGTFNVGVKDKTRGTKGWTLKAQLTGNIASQPGVSIETKNGSGEVKVNNNGNLEALTDQQVVGARNVSISGTEALIMTGQEGKVHNDVYDYDLGNVSLKIADAKKVQAGTHTGSVNWNLSQTPGN